MGNKIRLPREIQMRPIAALVPYAKNSRKHTSAQIDRVARSMREFGGTNPVLVDKAGNIIAGHARVLAAERIGLEQVPTIDLSHLSDAQRRAYILADNRLAEDASWDRGLLRVEIEALHAEAFDLDTIGFSASELERLLGPADGLTDPDELPTDAPRRTSDGDLWVLGRHRLLVGDATDAASVACLFGDEVPLGMVTDPPYGVNYDPEWRSRVQDSPRTRKMGRVMNDDRADWREAWALFPGDVAYVWHAGTKARVVQESLEVVGFNIRAQIIWVKDSFALSRGHYHAQHEPCFYGVRRRGHWTGDRTQSTVWEIPAREDSGHGHSTQKPVECMRRPMLNNSEPGAIWYDPFVGSGTSIIAAESCDRRCFAFELEPRYADIVLARWEAFSGGTASLEKNLKGSGHGDKN